MAKLLVLSVGEPAAGDYQQPITRGHIDILGKLLPDLASGEQDKNTVEVCRAS